MAVKKAPQQKVVINPIESATVVVNNKCQKVSEDSSPTKIRSKFLDELTRSTDNSHTQASGGFVIEEAEEPAPKMGVMKVYTPKEKKPDSPFKRIMRETEG